MQAWMELALHSGRSAVEIALFTLLPIMMIVLCVIRLLETYGVLDWLLRTLEPCVRWLGIPSLGLLAALQMSFVSFAAPLSALSLMEQRGYTQRHLASTLAMVLAMAQANVLFPMVSIGLDVGPTLLFSWIGGLTAAALTYYGWGRHLGPSRCYATPPRSERPHSLLDALHIAGKEALRIVISALPMLTMALLLIASLQRSGALPALFAVLEPVLNPLHLDYELFLRTLTKYVGGGMALFGVELQAAEAGQLHPQTLNQRAGWLIHSTDIPGIAVLCAAGPRTAAIWPIAILGALCGIGLRTVLHACYFA